MQFYEFLLPNVGMIAFLQFQEGEAPNAYAFALVDHRDGKKTLSVLTYLRGEVKQLDKMEVEASLRLLKMLSIFKIAESFVWILKVTAMSAQRIKN